MAAAFPIPVSILTGFLGSGKTTLLNRLLKDAALADTAVIVNEFGEVAIDNLLIEQSSDGVIELSDGCICCSVRGELVDTLADLVERVQTGRLERLARVVIETTGLADPIPVLQSIMAHPVLTQAFRLDGLITVVDAVNGAATLERHEEAVRQAAVADRIVLSKTDLDEARAGEAELRAALAGINPRAPILTTASTPDAALLKCGLYDPATKTARVAEWLGAEHDHHHHDHAHDGHDHSHDHHHAGGIRSFTLRHEGPLPLTTVENFLDLLRATQGEKLLRMKGIIEIAEDPQRPLVIHGVQRLLHPPARLPSWPEGARGTRLVLIVDGMAEEEVRRLFAAFTGAPQIDTPDRAAVEDNPLAISGFRG